MAGTRFSLSWNAEKGMCKGLASLQQNGEFVDMTLAADGHFVKVHQVVLALASPYLRELISSAPCQHPVIFLNKVSYETLCYLLEYVYTGEVLVHVDNLNELLLAGRELHIKGISEMSIEEDNNLSQRNNETVDDVETIVQKEETVNSDAMAQGTTYENVEYFDSIVYSDDKISVNKTSQDQDTPTAVIPIKKVSTSNTASGSMQYTVSNQGSLQMILNRYVYYLKYTTRDNHRQWRCVDYVTNVRCPAYVIAKGDVVLKRVAAHKHEFHDKRILKKLQAGTIFTAIHDAEVTCMNKQKEKKNEQNVAKEKSPVKNIDEELLDDTEIQEHNIGEKSEDFEAEDTEVSRPKRRKRTMSSVPPIAVITETHIDSIE